MSKLIEELQVYGDLLPNTVFQVVTLHPLADETKILERLDMQPNECASCDLYWVFKNEMFFVSIFSNSQENPLVTYFFKPNVDHGHSFYVVTHVTPLYATTIETVLKYLSNWIINNHKQIRERLTKKKVRITNKDICKS